MLQGMLVDDSMSNLTSASNEASISSSNRTEIPTTVYPQQSFAISPDNPTQPPPKKKRNLPGNPDPEAEVVALSPKSLLATNRFICEICNKGFQRDQNLQLHRRGHNLPWKLKQRNNKEVVKKKVYVCPEPSCVHHDPSRALGDLTGIKKHFSRKHGEKKWKCEKCSKRYAVQSDWKAHSKICGTREYRCDCGTLFSRRDSFITHRAFCDALAEESARSMTHMNPLLSSQQGTSSIPHPPHLHGLQPFSLKQEQSFSSRTEIPPWMTVETGLGAPGLPRGELFTSSSRLEQSILHQENTNPKSPTFSSALNPSNHISATALLQKAAQIGVTMSSSNSKTCTAQSDGIFRAHLAHMGAPGFSATSLDSSTAGAGLGLSSSREEIATGFVNVTSGRMEQLVGATVGANSSMLHDMNMLASLPPNSGFEGSSAFEDTFNRMLNSKRDNNFQENLPNPGTSHLNIVSKEATAAGGSGAGGGGGGGIKDGMTRDFLGLRAFPHRDFLNMAGFDQMGSSSYDQHAHQNQPPWRS